MEYYEHEAPSPCLFIHGAGGNSLLWKRSLQHVRGPSKAYAIDLPGHPTGEITCRTVREYAEVVHEFIASMALARPAVCGHSMGSAIALSLAIEHPADVGGLILVGAGAKLGVDPRIVKGLQDEPLKTIENLITPMSYYKIDLGLGREARAVLSFSNIAVFLNDYLACDGFDVRERLKSIAAESLIVCGDKDKMTPPKWAHYLGSKIVTSEVYFVKDSGHMLPLEKPVPLGRLVESFLSSFSQ